MFFSATLSGKNDQKITIVNCIKKHTVFSHCLRLGWDERLDGPQICTWSWKAKLAGSFIHILWRVVWWCGGTTVMFMFIIDQLTVKIKNLTFVCNCDRSFCLNSVDSSPNVNTLWKIVKKNTTWLAFQSFPTQFMIMTSLELCSFVFLY